MKRESLGPILTTVFVDYDNVYLSLKRKSDEAAKRFSKDAGRWIREIAAGRLMTATNGMLDEGPRRIVMNRCYGNPVPRRNQSDNSTDMSSFPFVRHHFLRAGFEVVDCPPLTAQLKNSADIRMVMDVRDILTHDTYFDEFVILSGDADFTPLLHRLRSHARRTVIYSNDNTAAPYTAICDAEIREADFLTLLLEGQLPNREAPAQVEAAPAQPALASAQPALPSASSLESMRKEILDEVISVVRASNHPVPLEALADRAVRVLGYDKTVGSAWGGVGSFRDLLARGLPEGIRLNGQPPYSVYDASRAAAAGQRRVEARPPESLRIAPESAGGVQRSLPPLYADQPAQRAPALQSGPPAQAQHGGPLAPAQSDALSDQPGRSRMQPEAAPSHMQAQPEAQPQHRPQPQMQPQPQPQMHAPQPQPAGRPGAAGATAIQQAIERIHEASQAPTLSPPDYRILFEVMAQEINANGLTGSQTLLNIVKRAQDAGVDVRRDDARFVLDVVSEADPWFDQGVSASLFASRFRNFVVARCRSQGLNLSADELDLVEAWFAGPPSQQQPRTGFAPSYGPGSVQPQQATPAPAPQHPAGPAAPNPELRGERWYQDDRQQYGQDQAVGGEEFPRIIRTRLRG